MTNIQSSTQAVETPGTKLTASMRLTILAWVVILIGSMVPAVIFRQFVPALPTESVLPSWLAWTQVIVLAVLLALSWVWSAVKPLRGLVLALLAFCVGTFFLNPLIMERTGWSNWLQQLPWGAALVASVLGGRLIPVVLMALTLIGSGLGRKDLFLTRGDINAPAQRSRLLWIKEPKPWIPVARQFILAYIIVLVSVVWLSVHPDLSKISQVLVYLPAIIIAAAINALAEEFKFRSVLLARLGSLVKSGQAILMTAVLFTSLHYYTGTPSGPLGAVAVMFLGWVAAKSMIETRGIVWAFIFHFLADFVIYAMYTMTI
jgi:membrane protease YdiL (CAAX protease family)